MAKNVALVRVGNDGNDGVFVMVPTAKLSAFLAIMEHCQLISKESVPLNTRYEGNYVRADYADYYVERAKEIDITINVASALVTDQWCDDIRAAHYEETARLEEENPYRCRAIGREYWGSRIFPSEEAARGYGDREYSVSGYEIGQHVDGDVVLV